MTAAFIWGVFLGTMLGVMIMSILAMSREEKPVTRYDGNKVMIIGTNAQGGVVTERHFDTKTAMAEAGAAVEFLTLNEGVREEGLRVARRRVGSLYVESESR